MGGKWVKQCLLGKEDNGRVAGVEGRSLSQPRLLPETGPASGKDSVCVLQGTGEPEQKVTALLWKLQKSIHHGVLVFFPAGACSCDPVLTGPGV